MEDDFENIKSIVTNVLGEPKREYSGNNGWYEYNCPCCANEHGSADNKYNFAVQIDESGLWGHCWKCFYHGKLTKIIKDYGSQLDVNDFRTEIKALREKRLFSLSDGVSSNIEELYIDEELSLPKGFKHINFDDYSCKAACDYLSSRGITQKIVDKYNIGYIGPYQGELSNRIIIPSYNMFGDLNYWIARDYTGKAYRKIKNPDVPKKEIVFNEDKINWYEPITIVEGPFDHIVVPNSIPLLGKSIDDTATLQQIIDKSKSNINIFLDDDAIDTAYQMYKRLNTIMPDRIRIIECPNGYDASDYYLDFGVNGIVSLLRSAHKLDEYTLATI